MTEDIPEVVNDLTTGGNDKTLSAEQGKALKAEIDYIRRCVAVREERTMYVSGWYRIAEGDRSRCKCCLLQVGQPWNYRINGGQLASVMFSNEVGSVKPLNALMDTTTISKIRYVYPTIPLTGISYMDMLINVDSRGDSPRVAASSIQDWEFYKADDWKLAEIPQGYAATEYDIT